MEKKIKAIVWRFGLQYNTLEARLVRNKLSFRFYFNQTCNKTHFISFIPPIN